MASGSKVIVVGAGPVGTIAAYALRRRGVPVVLVEALLAPEIDCRAASCHPPTIAMLAELDLLEAGLEQGLVSPVFHYMDRPTGQRIARFDIREMQSPPEHPYVLQWEQYKISATILERLQADAGCEVMMGARLTEIIQDADKVRAVLETAEGVVEIDGDYLVGCDGGRSTVRRLAEIEFEGFTWPERFLKVDTHFDFMSLRPDLSNRNYFSDPDEWMNLFKARGPDGGGLWRAVSPTLPEQTDEELLSPDAIEARLQKFCPKDGPYEIATVALYRVHQRVAATFNKGRVLLAGDAAHVNNPVGGMGMNGGIHDAVNLAAKLDDILNGGAEAQPLLDRYSRQRRKAQTDFVQAQSIQNKKTLGEKDPEARVKGLEAIRQAGLDPDLHDAFIGRACLIDSVKVADAVL
ncbi:NAD(P)/FAD-dependent oxidoreductase [Phenylobacterium sp.]|uniref:FAD-dependent oxidoreductase n=1 Tax=Phenylobacterium sp. TaxID=1871053 RepID=UPI00272F17F2|nr:FAD-dependent monooxygenase [Phenylobacterium sp.]MDP1616329.1 FAD-dependent monooxygenase [Phenylobacterium sp.]MDP1987167.1 FAD-dependent monooxygenase [Phenylobacterium sp.]